MSSEIQRAMKQVEKLRARLLVDLNKALDDVEEADARLVDAIRAARDGGISYREMRDATGRRSHEFFRSLLNRELRRRS